MNIADELTAASFKINADSLLKVGLPVVPLDTALEKVAALERENERLREKLVDLAFALAAHETAEDRKRILESEDVRSIMDLRLR